MITFNHVIEYDPQEFNDLRFLIVSDQHYGHADADLKRYRKVLKDNLGQPNQFLITNGDGLDCIVPGDKRFEMGGIASYLKESMRSDEILDMQRDTFIADHEPYKEQIIGLGIGNHENEIRKRQSRNVHRDICTALGVKNLGYMSIMQFILRPKGADGRSRTYRYMQHHGAGGSNATEGGGLSTFASFALHFNVDAAWFGHKHDYVYKRITRIGINRTGRQTHEDMIVGLTGSFLKTFNASDNPSWPETKMFKPKYLRGGYILRLIPDHDNGIDAKVSEA